MEITKHSTSIPNYSSFDFFYFKFDHSSYSKKFAKYLFVVVVTCLVNKIFDLKLRGSEP
jgi:hypothetical protein